MNRPEWGAMYFDRAVEEGATMYWGARGAIRDRKLEIYWDRQSFVADDATDKADFVAWINDHLIPYLEKQVKLNSTENIEAHNKDGRFHAVAQDRNSGGYLYIGAWAVSLWDEHEPFFIED